MFKLVRASKIYSSHNVNTRNKYMIQPVHHRLSMCKKTRSFSGPQKWNCLSFEIRNIQTIGKFKKKKTAQVSSVFFFGFFGVTIDNNSTFRSHVDNVFVRCIQIYRAPVSKAKLFTTPNTSVLLLFVYLSNYELQYISLGQSQ